MIPPRNVNTPVGTSGLEFRLLIVSVPAPSFVRLVALKAVPKVIFPAPPKVRLNAPPNAVPLFKVRVPASELIRASLAKVIAPPKELLLAILSSAPSPFNPAPFKVRASAPIVIPP